MIEYQINLSGTECSVVEWNPDGSVLVFALHGWLDNLATFECLVEHMPDIRLIAFDFPGHGHSAHIAPGSAYHFLDGIYLIDDLARHFNQQRINLLGHSMGGAVSTLYAASQNKRVAKLAIIESLGPLTAEVEEAVYLLRNAVKQRALLAEKRKPVYTSFGKALTARAHASQIDEAYIKPIVERGLTKVDGGYTWRADSRLRTTSPSRLSEEQLKAVLSEITAPVLFVEGDKGLLRDNERVQNRKSDFSNLKVELVAGGHHVHLEQPGTCGQLIQDFFIA